MTEWSLLGRLRVAGPAGALVVACLACGGMVGRLGAAGYESWFVSARDPASPRALWIRHTRHRPGHGPGSVALWCAVFDRELGQRPGMIKQVFTDFPAGAAAGPERFRGQATMGGQAASWDLVITGEEPALRPLVPAVLYRSPLPRTKLAAIVPDGQVTGLLQVADHRVSVSGWRGTVGHNWGSEHADSWVWLHAEGFGGAPEAWLDLVLARIKLGPARLPWTAMGALSLGGERIVLGGLGRRVAVDARPGLLTAAIPTPAGRLRLSVAAVDDAMVAVPYTDPRGGTRTVSHAGLASAELTLPRPGGREASLSTTRAAYEFGSGEEMPGITRQRLPEG